MSRAWKDVEPPLEDFILDFVSSSGFSQMTPVQAAVIPLFLKSSDVVVEAVTGSGKTLSFLVPIVQRLLRLAEPLQRHHVGAIIVSPTRELAAQIHTVLCSLLAFRSQETSDGEDEQSGDDEASWPPQPSKIASRTPTVTPQLLISGSLSPTDDIRTFVEKSPNLLVGTPGRLVALLASKKVKCVQNSFEALVLDEADRLLDLGFKDELQSILKCLPKQRRTGLFSASVSEAVDQIVRVGLRNPVRVAVKVKSASGSADKITPSSLQLSYLLTPPTHKIPSLVRLVTNPQLAVQKCIVYVSTCATVEYFQHILPVAFSAADNSDVQIVPLHGKQTPEVRQKNLSRFVNHPTPSCLLTTDVASRGLDLPAPIDLVLQLDPPSDPKTFIHRAGRSGRAGRKGLSIVFLTPGREAEYVSLLSVRKTPLSHFPPPATTHTAALHTLAAIKRHVLTDRALHDKAQRAFVSWVQAYRKHAASSIFRVADLDWAALGAGWALLRLPKMPELRGWEGDRSLGNGAEVVDFDTYAYRDKARERQRVAELAAWKAGDGLGGGREMEKDRKKKGAGAWSQKQEQAVTRVARREKKAARRAHDRREGLTAEQRKEEEELGEMIKRVRQANEAAD